MSSFPRLNRVLAFSAFIGACIGFGYLGGLVSAFSPEKRGMVLAFGEANSRNADRAELAAPPRHRRFAASEFSTRAFGLTQVADLQTRAYKDENQIDPSRLIGQKWIGWYRCGNYQAEMRLEVQNVGPVQKYPGSLDSTSPIIASIELLDTNGEPLAAATLDGKFSWWSKSFDLSIKSWKIRNQRSQGAFNGVQIDTSARNQVARGKLSAFGCDEFSMSTDPVVAEALIEKGRRNFGVATARRADAEAKVLERRREARKTETNYISVKTGEELDCPVRRYTRDGNLRRHIYCGDEEALARYYVDPGRKRYSTDGRGEAYMALMGLKHQELAENLRSVRLDPQMFAWSEPLPVKDVNGRPNVVYAVLGCLIAEHYCADSFEYADAAFLVDEESGVGFWFTNLKTGSARTCRLVNGHWNCVIPKPKMDNYFNELYSLPVRFINPISSIREQVKGNFEWARLSDKDRAIESERIVQETLGFMNALSSFAATAPRSSDSRSEDFKAWASRQDRAFDWASQVPGRSPSEYHGY